MPRTPSEVGSRIIRAGAGAGKTTRLIAEVESMAESFFRKHERWPRLVLTTFTIKATQELRERLFLRSTQTDPEKSHSLTEFVLSNQNLMITTIHGVLSQYLRSGAELIGWDPNFRFVDEAEDQRNAKGLLAELVFGEDSIDADILEEVRFQTLLTTMLKYARQEWIHDSFSFATLSDFQATATLLRQRLTEQAERFLMKAEQFPMTEGWLQTCQSVRELHQIATQSALSWKEVRDRLIDLNIDPKKPRAGKKNTPIPELEEPLELLREEIKQAKTEMWSQEFWEKVLANSLHVQNLGKRFSEKFWEQKKISGALSLSDLEPLALQLAKTHPESAQKFAADWDYWLIDEYQDTSPLQNQLMDLFVKESAAFYVGDPQQSIYYFRGARSEVFNSRFDSAATNHMAQEELATNYRSRPSLMRFFNHFFTSGPQPFKELTPGLSEIEATESDALFFQCEDPASEIRSVCQRVVGLINQGTQLDSIAIIARTNDDLYKISAELVRRGVATHVHASSQFGIRREILDLRMICGFLLNPNDDEAAIATFRTPWFYIPDDALAEIAKKRKNDDRGSEKSLWSYLLKTSAELSTVQRLNTLLQHLSTSSLSSTLLEVLQQTGIVDVSQVHDSTGQRESNLWKFVLLLKQAEHTPGFNAIHFLQQWNQVRSALSEEGDAVAALEPNRVNLLTIHASKGLQFAHVIVPFLSRSPRFGALEFFESDENGLWSVKARGEDDEYVTSPFHWELSQRKRVAELEESDRLLYVAATRAKSSIAFTMLGEPARESWQSRFRWNSTLGKHSGNGFTYEILPAPQEIESLIRSTLPKASVVREKFSEVVPLKKVARLTVSSLAEGATVTKGIPKDFLMRPVRGVMFHQKMERIQKHVARFDGALTPSLSKDPDVQWVLSMTEVPMKEILMAGFAEWPFQVSLKDRVVVGQIDLWGQVGERIWIVDYKTGTSRNLEKAIEQLQVYGWAVNQAHPHLPITLVTLFPLEKKVFTVDFNSEKAQTLLNQQPITL